MKQREAGQAFILVLIILAVGTLTVIPALRLTIISLKSVDIITRYNLGLSAAEAAQEYVMWDLFYGNMVQRLPNNNDSENFTLDICGTPVEVSVVMRAVEIEGGTILATDHRILPTKTVTPNQITNPTDADSFTYTIILEHVSANNSKPLVAVYDVLPPLLGSGSGVYMTGSSFFSSDNISWDSIGDPSIETEAQQTRLRWPASGNFSSDIGFFQPGETKYLRFEVDNTFTSGDKNRVACNRIVVQTGDIFTLSAPEAPIVIGPDFGTFDPDRCQSQGTFDVYKTSDPTTIPPLVATNVTYTIHITNMESETKRIAWIDDYLPPGFEYTGPTSGDVTIEAPFAENVTRNGVERQHLWWESGYSGAQLTVNGVNIGGGANMTLTFVAEASQGISGTYYNEVLVQPDPPNNISLITDIDPSLIDQVSQTYSWNSGTIIVPAYDSNTSADGANITANMALEPDRVNIISWSVK